jgi:hypothetical protein
MEATGRGRCMGQDWWSRYWFPKTTLLKITSRQNVSDRVRASLAATSLHRNGKRSHVTTSCYYFGSQSSAARY